MLVAEGAMPTTLICPTCGASADVHLDGDALRIDYDYGAWSRRCAHPGIASMSTCPGMQSVVQLLVTQLRLPDDRTDDEQ
jgi:hypothetical protein